MQGSDKFEVVCPCGQVLLTAGSGAQIRGLNTIGCLKCGRQVPVPDSPSPGGENGDISIGGNRPPTP